MSNNVPQHHQSFFDDLSPVLELVDRILTEEWDGEGCLQFPTLMGKVITALSWDTKATRATEPIIREFIRKHPTWCVTRGAHGGIMKRAKKEEKEALLAAKLQAKADMKRALEAEEAKKKAEALAAKAPATDQDNTNSTEIITE